MVYVVQGQLVYFDYCDQVVVVQLQYFVVGQFVVFFFVQGQEIFDVQFFVIGQGCFEVYVLQQFYFDEQVINQVCVFVFLFKVFQEVFGVDKEFGWLVVFEQCFVGCFVEVSLFVVEVDGQVVGVVVYLGYCEGVVVDVGWYIGFGLFVVIDEKVGVGFQVQYGQWCDCGFVVGIVFIGMYEDDGVFFVGIVEFDGGKEDGVLVGDVGDDSFVGVQFQVFVDFVV